VVFSIKKSSPRKTQHQSKVRGFCQSKERGERSSAEGSKKFAGVPQHGWSKKKKKNYKNLQYGERKSGPASQGAKKNVAPLGKKKQSGAEGKGVVDGKKSIQDLQLRKEGEHLDGGKG